MTSTLDLARQLIAIDTVAANEDEALTLLSAELAAAGFELVTVPWQAGRSNIVARWRGGGRLTYAAHVDTVPFDRSLWSVDPLGGEVIDGRLYGRGSSDMKAATAAMVTAAIDAARDDARGFTLVLTSAEETGCEGARSVAARADLLDPKPLFVIGEATGNGVLFGHKGATWLEATATGVSAHGSRPDLGVNAIDRAADAVVALRSAPAGGVHAALGARTVNVGTITGGQQTNLVPAHARFTVDVRTVPGASASPISDVLSRQPDVAVSELLEVPAIWTEPSAPGAAVVSAVVAELTGRAATAGAATYFTDGAVLAPEGVGEALILGPGAPDQPHTTDEYCAVSALNEADAIYRGILQRWTEAAF